MKPAICPVCEGRGSVSDPTGYGSSCSGFYTKVCHGCGGKGWVEVGEQCGCPNCKGCKEINTPAMA